jgi:hypothetical protein
VSDEFINIKTYELDELRESLDELRESLEASEDILSMWKERLIEDFRHLHLPSEYIWSYFYRDRERERDEEDREILLQAIQNNNRYALFRYMKTFRGHSD